MLHYLEILFTFVGKKRYAGFQRKVWEVERADQFRRWLLFSCSIVSDSDLMDCSTPGLPDLHYLPEFAQTPVLWVSDTIQLSHPLSPPTPPAFSLSQHQGLFQWFGSWWPKYRSFSFSINPSNEHSGLISFRINWFDPLVVQGTLKSLLQRYSLKASILWRLAYFMVQFSHPYMTTGKTIALTRCTFVDKGTKYKQRCLCFLICCLGLL